MSAILSINKTYGNVYASYGNNQRSQHLRECKK